MPGGRPRTPTALHKARGTFRPDRHNTSEPPAKAATTKIPAWAKLTGEARKCYQRLAPMLSDMRVLTEPDVAALVQLARRYEEYMDARAQVEDEGVTYVVENKNGRQRHTNPAAMVRDRAWLDFQRGLTEFGLTPVSRAKIAAAPESDKSPMERMLSGNG